MRSTQVVLSAVALSIGLFTTTNTHASLIPALGGQVVNDTDLNITWLANANLAATNTFGITGYVIYPGFGWMTWATAKAWIGAMNTANYLGYSDWRLPTSDTCTGFNCTGSEMGHLYYNELGGVGYPVLATVHNDNYNLFSNIVQSSYFSGTEYQGTGGARNFYFDTGNQGAGGIYNVSYAWAVRDGQVSTVPVPAAA